MSTKNKILYRKQTDFDLADAKSRKTATVNDQPSLTVQGPAQEADINYIATMFGLNQASRLPLPPEASDPRFYGDFSEAPADLQTALERVRDASAHFALLPADIRAKFKHSPVELWNWLQDSKNHAEAVELGILVDVSPKEKVVTNAAVAPTAE